MKNRVWLGTLGMIALMVSAPACIAVLDWDFEAAPGEGGNGGMGVSSSTASTGGGGSGGGGGVGPVCITGVQQPCYDGPIGTENIGECKSGVQTCIDGIWGPCEKQVLPAAQELCDGIKDDNCNGVSDEPDGCVCVPGSKGSCYMGPQNTDGIGECKSGTHTCQPDGKEYGNCFGEVTPFAESCSSSKDVNCDGSLGCSGTHIWSKRFGDSDNQFGKSIAGDKSGNVVSVGTFDGSLDFGSGALNGFHSIFVAKWDPTGQPLWSKNVGGIYQYAQTAVETDFLNNIVIAGSFNGTLNFGGATLTNNDNPNVFIAKLDSMGNHLWSKQFGDVESQSASQIAIDAVGNVVVAGIFAGVLDFGNGPLTGKSFLAKFDSKGNHLWSKAFDDGSTGPGISGIAADANGNVLVTGGFKGTMNLGGSNLQSNGAAPDIFVAKFDSAGAHLWSKAFGSAGAELPRGIAVDGGGNTVLTGTFYSTFDFGGPGLVGPGGGDVYVAKLDASGGHIWSKSFGDADVQDSGGVAVDGAGNVLLTGYFLGMFTFGGPVLTSMSPAGDTYLAKLDPTGAHVWSKRFGDPNPQSGLEVADVATDISGNVLLAGILSGSLDMGGGVLQGAGGSDVLVAKFSP